MTRALLALLLVACAAPVAAPEPEHPAPAPAHEPDAPQYITITRRPASGPPADCEDKKWEITSTKADLEAATEEREAYQTAHCQKQIATETSIRVIDGKRFSRPSPSGDWWLCDDGQMTNGKMYSQRERDLHQKIRLAAIYLRQHECP